LGLEKLLAIISLAPNIKSAQARPNIDTTLIVLLIRRFTSSALFALGMKYNMLCGKPSMKIPERVL
nr:hypothetical protein [Candidatus Cloacimonadota bacterium]